MCKLIQFHICSNRALKFLTLSVVLEAEVLSLLSLPCDRVSARGFLPRNHDRAFSKFIAFSVSARSLALFDLFFLGLRVFGAFALALVGWSSCGEYNPKRSANYLSIFKSHWRRRQMAIPSSSNALSDRRVTCRRLNLTNSLGKTKLSLH